MILRSINLEGHKNFMKGEIITAILTTLFVHDSLGLFFLFFFIWKQSTVDKGGVSRERSVAVGSSERWKVT